MREEATLNRWLQTFGYRWLPGEERLEKGSYTFQEARGRVDELRSEGAIEYVGHPSAK